MGQANIIVSCQDRASATIDHITKQLGLFNKAGLSAGISMAVTTKAIDMASQAFNFMKDRVIESVSMYREFEKEVIGLTSVANMAGMSIDQISATLRGMSLIFGDSAIDIAKNAETISREYGNIHDTVNILVSAERLHVATNTDLNDSTQAIVTTLQAYNLAASQSNYVAELLAKSYKTTGTSIKEIADMIARVGPISQEANIDLAELAGIFTELSSRGLPLRSSVAGYKTLLESLAAPSKEQLDLMMSQSIAYDDLSVKEEGFIGLLSRIRSELEGNSDAFRNLTGGAEAYNIALALTATPTSINNIKSFKDGLNDINEMYDKNSASSEYNRQVTQAWDDQLKLSMGKQAEGAFAWFDRVKTVGLGIITYGGDTTKYITSLRNDISPALDAIIKSLRTDEITKYSDAFQLFADNINSSKSLFAEITDRIVTYGQEVERLGNQKQILIQTHDYVEALRYIPMALEDAAYTTKIFDKNTQALVDSIRIQRDEIERLTDANSLYALSESKNSLEIQKIQYAAYDSRRGLTRGQERAIKDLEKANLGLRISETENQIAIDTTRAYGLNAEERNLEKIKRDYDEYIYKIKDTYGQELASLGMTIDYKNKLIDQHKAYLGSYNQPGTVLGDMYTNWVTYYAELNKLPADTITEIKKNVVSPTLPYSPTSPTSTGVSPILNSHDLESIFNTVRRGLGNLPTRQSGGYIPATGPYLLHKGETVTPANHTTNSPINITNNIHATINNEMDANKLAKLVASATSKGLIDQFGVTNVRMR